MYYLKSLTFIEQPVFTRLLAELVEDDAYRKFQNELAANPEKGPVVKGSGGLRKVRLALPGRGKSGGARVLYLWFPRHQTIVFYFVYTKGEMENVPAAQMKAVKHEVQRIKKTFGEGD
jgi:mRNA-degrading endonuclease RelE of RelBE toxin-antitoxin system